MRRNAYFQLTAKKDGLYVVINPPEDGGETIRFYELNMYLHKNKIAVNDAEALKKALASTHEKTEIRLSILSGLPVNEQVSLKISPDRQEVIGRFYCAAIGGRPYGADEIQEELASAGIKFGIIKENIDMYLRDRQYCTDIPLARGVALEESRNAFIEYKLETDKKARPTLLENGSVDFQQMNIINFVNEGDVLAVLSPAIEGKPGVDVYGVRTMPAKATRLVLRPGSGTALSEDKCKLIATRSGHAEIKDDRITILDTFKMNGNVDASTGNIFFEGSVEIRGDVCAGRIVEATGNIFVEGVVEGASLSSGAHILVSRGIQGGNKASLKAAGNVIAKFIENCTIVAGGSVTAEAILYSKISASGDILVKGIVRGGELRSSSMISLKTAGSELQGANTLLKVGVEPEIITRRSQMEKDLVAKQIERKRIQQVYEKLKQKAEGGEEMSPDNVALLNVIPDRLKSLVLEMKDMLEAYSVVKEEIEAMNSGRIKVENIIYPGVKIEIAGASYYIRTAQQHCQFMNDGADIRTLMY